MICVGIVSKLLGCREAEEGDVGVTGSNGVISAKGCMTLPGVKILAKSYSGCFLFGVEKWGFG